MPQFDLSLAQLQDYYPQIHEPADFGIFWDETLDQARQHHLDAQLEIAESPVALVDSFDVTYSGFGGHRVRAWLHLPAGSSGPLPLVIEYIGYTRGRGLVFENMDWVLAGYAHLVVDNRGQGWDGSRGDTPDPSPEAGDPAVPGQVTRGILRPETYYYRRLYTDAVRAVDLALSLPGVDHQRILLAGTSQGGGTAIAAAALADGPIGVMVDVPFLCHVERAVTITDNNPYQEIAQYLRRYPEAVDQVFRTLAYVDGANFAKRAQIPAFFSVALMDQTCPPSTVYAAYNRWAHEDRSIEVYPFNRHEGGEGLHLVKKFMWARALLA